MHCEDNDDCAEFAETRRLCCAERREEASIDSELSAAFHSSIPAHMATTPRVAQIISLVDACTPEEYGAVKEYMTAHPVVEEEHTQDVMMCITSQMPEELLIHVLSLVPPTELNPYTIRATSKTIRTLYDQDEGVWHKIVIYYDSDHPGHPWSLARQQCNERLRAPLLEALPKNKMEAFVQSRFQTLNLSHERNLRSLPKGIQCCHR